MPQSAQGPIPGEVTQLLAAVRQGGGSAMDRLMTLGGHHLLLPVLQPRFGNQQMRRVRHTSRHSALSRWHLPTTPPMLFAMRETAVMPPVVEALPAGANSNRCHRPFSYQYASCTEPGAWALETSGTYFGSSG